MLSDYVGSDVKINFGGPESRTGELVAVKSDYLVLNTEEEGVVYYQLSHIKGASIKVTEDDPLLFSKVSFLDKPDFEGVLEALKYKKVKVNRGGPESVKGVLNDLTSDSLVLSVNDDLLLVPVFHIKSVSRILRTRRSSDETFGQSSDQLSGQDLDMSLAADETSKAGTSATPGDSLDGSETLSSLSSDKSFKHRPLGTYFKVN